MLVLLACQKEKEEPADDSERIRQNLQTVVDKFIVENPEIPGVVAMLNINGRHPIQASAGLADLKQGEKMTADHKLAVASNTKMLTAVIILQLMEEEKLRLNDPVSLYLPASVVNKLCVINDVSFGQFITIAQLLKHKSGIYDYIDVPFLSSTVSAPQRFDEPDELVDYASRAGAPYFIPGTAGAYHYSSTNYILLGMIIEKVCNKPYQQVLRERILQPLDMKNSSLLAYENRTAPYAHGYYAGNDITNSNLSWTWATGGLLSNAADLNKFMFALMSGKLFKHPFTLRWMLNMTTESLKEYGYSYGLGILQYDFGYGFIAQGHVGSLHGYCTAIFYLPLTNTVMFIGFNRGYVSNELFDLVGKTYQCLVNTYEPRPALFPSPAQFPGFGPVH